MDHVLELQIACNPADTRRVMPAIRPEHRRILDVGCGAGQTLIASALGAEVTALGIDRDLEALKLGRKLGKRIDFICASGETLPFRDGHFDLVLSRVALPYMNTRAALAEMTRVLQPGGEIWLALHPFERVVDELTQNARAGHIGAALHRVYALANGALAHLTEREFANPVTGRYASFQTEPAMVRKLQSLGFEDIRAKKDPFFVVTARKRKDAPR